MTLSINRSAQGAGRGICYYTLAADAKMHRVGAIYALDISKATRYRYPEAYNSAASVVL